MTIQFISLTFVHTKNLDQRVRKVNLFFKRFVTKRETFCKIGFSLVGLNTVEYIYIDLDKIEISS